MERWSVYYLISQYVVINRCGRFILIRHLINMFSFYTHTNIFKHILISV